MEPVVKLIKARNGSESVFIVTGPEQVDQVLYGLVENTDIRMMIMNRLGEEEATKLANKRPIPQFNTIIATTDKMNRIFQQAIDKNLIKFEDRWNLMFLDPHQNRFNYQNDYLGVTRIVLSNSFYCQWFPETRGRNCDWPDGEFNVSEIIFII